MLKKTYAKPRNTRAKKPKANATSFHIIEAYKNLRANLLFALSVTGGKSVVISSAEPDAGKSNTCSNLAKTMSQTGCKVLIIDADMRKPMLHTSFKLANNYGLSKLLSGQDTLEQSIHKNIAENLDIITSGPVPPNSSELLGGSNMIKLISMLEDHYDYIFIDTPPINMVSDAMVLCSHTAGALLAVRQGQTLYDQLNKAVQSLKMAKSNILGVVITDVVQSKSAFSSYKYRYYEYGKE